MSMAVRATLLFICFSVCASAQTRTLGLFLAPARGLDAESTSTLQLELQRLLKPAGLNPAFRKLEDRKSGEDFELISVISFEGVCSIAEPPSGAPQTTVKLADTSVSDGRVLPFFKVDCGRLVSMLRQELDVLEPAARPALFGRALARVMAHEIYHVVGQTTDHEDRGVAKSTFTIRDLTTSRFEFDMWSLARMKPPSVAAVSASDNGESGR